MRCIHCPKCAEACGFRDLPASREEPAERVRRVDGVLIRDVVCDRCGLPLPAGVKATCWSVWREDCLAHVAWWEHEYVRAEP